MGNNRREEIIMTTLELASEKGLGNVSLSMIADRVGIKKPSIYNHFNSKDEIVEEMYRFLRESALEQTNVSVVDYSELFIGKSAFEVLQQVVSNYETMNQQKYIRMFYKVVYSERCINSMAAKIMAEETEKMILATKTLFYAMEAHCLLHFKNIDMSAVSFALTIHGFMDFKEDVKGGKQEVFGKTEHLMNSYLKFFCEENAVKTEV